MGLVRHMYAIYHEEGFRELRSRIQNHLIKQVYPHLPGDVQQTVGNYLVGSDEELLQYWQDPDDEVDELARHFELEKESRFLIDLMEPRISSSDHILEIGCNVGRNLHYLYQAGYQNLSGIEINAEALELLEEQYPEVHEHAELYNASVEDVILEIPTDAIDVTFTFALLAHIHPDNDFVFEEIVRVTDDTIVTFENEETVSHKQVPRNYRDVFEALGCTQVGFVGGEEVTRRTDQRPAYRARVFNVT